MRLRDDIGGQVGEGDLTDGPIGSQLLNVAGVRPRSFYAGIRVGELNLVLDRSVQGNVTLFVVEPGTKSDSTDAFGCLRTEIQENPLRWLIPTVPILDVLRAFLQIVFGVTDRRVGPKSANGIPEWILKVRFAGSLTGLWFGHIFLTTDQSGATTTAAARSGSGSGGSGSRGDGGSGGGGGGG